MEAYLNPSIHNKPKHKAQFGLLQKKNILSAKENKRGAL